MKSTLLSLSMTENLSLVYWVSLYLVIFAVPLVLSGPQLVVGTVVNACLFIAAKQTTTSKLIPLAILPSLAAIMHGVVLGSFSQFLLIMAPFIWVSNFILMVVYKQTNQKLIGLPLASLAKTAWLFSIAFLLVNLGVLPKIFLTSMGVFQLATALLGGSLALILASIMERKA
jgi:hypothetical protein